MMHAWHRGTFYNLLKFGDSPSKSMLPYVKAVAAAGVRVWVFRSVDINKYNNPLNMRRWYLVS
jgi:hypothetical protein